jgi:hypothetical protein
MHPLVFYIPPHSFLLVLVPSAIVPSIPLLAYPSTPPCLFTYSYIPTYSMCLLLSFNTTCCCSLCALSLLIPSLPPRYIYSTHTIFFAPSTPVCFRVYCYTPRVSLYLPVLFVCLFLILCCKQYTFSYTP